jgi:hypothetical protein
MNDEASRRFKLMITQEFVGMVYRRPAANDATMDKGRAPFNKAALQRTLADKSARNRGEEPSRQPI